MKQGENSGRGCVASAWTRGGGFCMWDRQWDSDGFNVTVLGLSGYFLFTAWRCMGCFHHLLLFFLSRPPFLLLFLGLMGVLKPVPFSRIKLSWVGVFFSCFDHVYPRRVIAVLLLADDVFTL